MGFEAFSRKTAKTQNKKSQRNFTVATFAVEEIPAQTCIPQVDGKTEKRKNGTITAKTMKTRKF